MFLPTGTRLGPYEVIGVIGAGGMGEVYRAHDTNLHRDVAIKVLPSAVANHPRRLVRFEREARALATLNHPNIATVFGIESSSSEHGRAIVMELVDGDDLSTVLRRGPVTLADALPIARQVAEALAAAHDAGIVHRDLKPANIKVRRDGTVKVLDFGLAQQGVADVEEGSGSHAGSGSGSRSGSGELPLTLTHHAGLTHEGAVLGTAAYMAPEQARGSVVDKRADIWAFGVVLFEMLSGQRPFSEDDPSEPAWRVLPADTPASIRRLLVRCLTRDRKRRLHDIADARLEIDEALAPAPDTVTPHKPWLRVVMAGLALVVAGAVIGIVAWPAAPAAPAVVHARLDLDPATELTSGGVHPAVVLPVGGARTALQWSPNGRALAFIGRNEGVNRIYLRDLSIDVAQPVPGTEGAQTVSFSPDGQQILFWSGNALAMVKTSGGPVVKVTAVPYVNGLTWGPTRIFYSMGSLFELSLTSSGGETSHFTSPPQLTRHSTPFLLPGDQALLYTEYQKQWTSGDERVVVQSLSPASAPRILIRNAADARYLSTGHLAFMRQGTLFVVPFDATTLQLRGEPVPVLTDVSESVVAWDSDDLTLASQFAVSSTGNLAYVASPVAVYPDRELVRFDRSGKITPVGAPVKGYRNRVDISPDGTRIAVSVQSATDVQLFAYDLTRGSLSRIAASLQGEVILGAWSRSNQIAVGVIDEGRISASLVRPDAASLRTDVADSTGFWPSSLTTDGRLAGMYDGDIWIHFPEGSKIAPTSIAQPKTEETQPVWSPDGRWIAYSSPTTGQSEVYVRKFPWAGEALAVSTNGGSSPAWNPNGRELFYVESSADRVRMMSVSFAADGHAGQPQTLFSIPPNGLQLVGALLTPYAVAPDGRSFYAVRSLPRSSTPVTQVNVIFNWLEEVKARFTPGR